jgi:hypothetical protein
MEQGWEKREMERGKERCGIRTGGWGAFPYPLSRVHPRRGLQGLLTVER